MHYRTYVIKLVELLTHNLEWMVV